ncbi:MAG: hypothetical protein E5X11_25410, partial [Mesorhizobium sp.]
MEDSSKGCGCLLAESQFRGRRRTRWRFRPNCLNTGRTAMKKMLLLGAAFAALTLGLPAHAELKFKP